MKRIFTMIALAGALFFAGCTGDIPGMDGIDIPDGVEGEVNESVLGRIEDLEERVAALEALCNQINTNIVAIQTVVNALQTNDLVKSVTPIMENGKEVGITVTFIKAQPISIYFNNASTDNSYTPVIGVKQDTDGMYYWTVDGEWLTDEAGNKIKAQGSDGKDGADGKDGQDGAPGQNGQDGAPGANGADGAPGQNGADGANGADGKDGQDGAPGKDGEDGKDGQDGAPGKDGEDGITPMLKIENDYWYVSYDNGANWVELGKATGEDGKDGADGQDGAPGKDGQDGAPGKDGQDGAPGKDGQDGAPGKDGEDGKDGQDGAPGKDGEDGKDGAPGKDGEDGDSFFQSVICNEGSVIFVLSDGTTFEIPIAGKEIIDRVKSITYVPNSMDKKASIVYDWQTDCSTVEMDFMISPVSVATELAESWRGFAKVVGSRSLTRAVEMFELEIDDFKVDNKGVVTIVIEDTEGTLSNGESLLAFSLSNGDTFVSSEFVETKKSEVGYQEAVLECADEIKISGEAGEVIFDLTTNYDWTITSDSEWLTVEPTSGKAGEVAKLTYQTNESEAERTAVLDVVCSNKVQTIWAQKSVTVKQAKFVNIDFSNPVDLSENGTSNCYIVNAPATAYKFKATVKGNGTTALSSDVAEIAPASVSVLWLVANITDENPKEDGKGWPGNLGNTDANSKLIIVESVELSEDGKYVYFATPEDMINGNAIVVARDAKGNVVWSWHLWILNGYDATASDHYVTVRNINTYMMDRNLGATASPDRSATPTQDEWTQARGFYYQWGRKDPFMGSCKAMGGYAPKIVFYQPDGTEVVGYAQYSSSKLLTSIAVNEIPDWSDVTSSVAYSVANPNVFISGNGDGSYSWVAASVDVEEPGTTGEWGKLWGNQAAERLGGVKTMYDPCPVGYRVPSTGHFRFITSHGDNSGAYYNKLTEWKYNCVEQLFDENGEVLNSSNNVAPFGLNFYVKGSKTAAEVAEGAQNYGIAPMDKTTAYFPAQGLISWNYSDKTYITSGGVCDVLAHTNCTRERDYYGYSTLFMKACRNGEFYVDTNSYNYGEQQAKALPVRCFRESESETDSKVDVSFGGSFADPN